MRTLWGFFDSLVVCLPQSVAGGAMLPPRRHPFPALLSCLASPVQRTGQSAPALGPDSAWLARVALGQCPSLPALRRGCLRRRVRPSFGLPVCSRFLGVESEEVGRSGPPSVRSIKRLVQ